MGKQVAAEAVRTEVRVEALRATISFGTAEAVPLTWPRAAIVSTSYPSRFICEEPRPDRHRRNEGER